MRKKIKTISTFCISIFLACSCNETRTNNVSIQNNNDALYDSLSNKLQKSNLHCDSLRMIFEQELSGSNGSFGFGPSVKKIESQIDSCSIVNKKIKVKLDSVFVLTSKEFKLKYYDKVLKELDIATTENKNYLIKLRISLEDEVKGGGYGLQAKKLESEILQLEEQIKTSNISKDSIQNILSKIK